MRHERSFRGVYEIGGRSIATSRLRSASTQDLTDIGFAQEISKELQASPLNRFKIFLAFGGKPEGGKVGFHTFSSLEPRVQSYFPVGNQLSFAFLYNGDGVDFDLAQALYSSLESFGEISPETTIRSQKILNNRIADLDESVNKVVFSQIIAW